MDDDARQRDEGAANSAARPYLAPALGLGAAALVIGLFALMWSGFRQEREAMENKLAAARSAAADLRLEAQRQQLQLEARIEGLEADAAAAQAAAVTSQATGLLVLAEQAAAGRRWDRAAAYASAARRLTGASAALSQAARALEDRARSEGRWLWRTRPRALPSSARFLFWDEAGGRVVAVFADGGAACWDRERLGLAGPSLAGVGAEPFEALDARFDAGSRSLVIAGAAPGSSQVELFRWSVQDGALERLGGADLGATAAEAGLRLSPDGARCAAARPRLMVFKAGAAPVPLLSRPARRILAWSADGASLYFSAEERAIAVAEVAGPSVRPFASLPSDAVDAASSPDGLLLATLDEESRVALWHRGSGRVLRVIAAPELMDGLLLSPDGRAVVARGRSGALWRLDFRGEEVWAPLLGHPRPPVAAAFLGPSQLVSAGADGGLRFWRLSGEQAPFSAAIELAWLCGWVEDDWRLKRATRAR